MNLLILFHHNYFPATSHRQHLLSFNILPYAWLHLLLQAFSPSPLQSSDAPLASNQHQSRDFLHHTKILLTFCLPPFLPISSGFFHLTFHTPRLPSSTTLFMFSLFPPFLWGFHSDPPSFPFSPFFFFPSSSFLLSLCCLFKSPFLALLPFLSSPFFLHSLFPFHSFSFLGSP